MVYRGLSAYIRAGTEKSSGERGDWRHMSIRISGSRGNGRFGLSANTIKLVAALAMVCDHMGAYLFPSVIVLRVIGRLAFPLFAYFIAEGCRYTRNKLKRFFLVFGLAVLCDSAYVVFSGELTGTVLVTFSCSILMIYALQALKRACLQKRGGCIVLTAALFALSVGATVLVGYFIPMDYGIPGAFLPVLLAFLDYDPATTPAFFRYLDRRAVRLAVFGAGILLVWWFRREIAGDYQLYALLALLPMAFYNGKPGTRRLKYWFYVFYPAHLMLIWAIGFLLNR